MSDVFRSVPSKTSHMHLHLLLYQVVALILRKDSKSLLCTTGFHLSFEMVGDVIPQQLRFKSEPVTHAILCKFEPFAVLCKAFDTFDEEIKKKKKERSIGKWKNARKSALQNIYRFQSCPLTESKLCGRGLQVLLQSHCMFCRVGAPI